MDLIASASCSRVLSASLQVLVCNFLFFYGSPCNLQRCSCKQPIGCFAPALVQKKQPRHDHVCSDQTHRSIGPTEGET
jgi:hypothetical protein